MIIIQLKIAFDPERPEDEQIIFSDGSTPEEETE